LSASSRQRRRVTDMKQALVLAAALSLLVTAGSGVSTAAQAAAAKTYGMSATMTPSQVVTPRNQPWRVPAALAKARGTLNATLDTKRLTLTWRLTYTGLAGQRLIIGDVHIGKPGRFGPILVRLCVECKSGQSGVKKVKATSLRTLLAGNTWMTLIAGQYPNGVIRGQLKVR
jgi:hypothetical protein